MKRILYFFATITLFFLACNQEDLGEEQSHNVRVVSITATMPGYEEVGTRVALEQDGKDITLTWRENDQVQLCFVQGTTKVKQEATVTNISVDGKHGTFEFTLPEEIEEGAFDLYGVHGGGGLSKSDPSLAILPINAENAGALAGIEERGDVMLVFSRKEISTFNPRSDVSFQHLGSLFNITLKNNGNSNLDNLAEARLIADINDWAYNAEKGGGYYDLVNEYFLDTERAGNYISFKTENDNLASGQSATFWGWYPSLPNMNWPELKLELRDNSGALVAVSTNTKPERRETTEYGKNYHFYAAWDGQEVRFTDSHFLDMDNFEINTGINIASWLSIPKYTGAQRLAFFQERDVELLASLGFDHIRLCVDEEQLWQADGMKIQTEGFDLLHDAIRWCIKHDMRVIVDLHTTRNHRFTNTENTLFTDPSEPAKFVKLWEDLSDELYKYPNSLVAYELLNEPVSANPANWNRVSELAINSIRAKEPNRTIIVGVCTSNFAMRYNNLTLPSTHKIMMTFHFYGPFLLTYYGAQSTTNGRRDIPLIYPGPPQLIPEEYISLLPVNWQETGRRVYDKQRLEASIMLGIDRARALGVPVFIGEFGTWNATPEPARANWYRDVVEILTENNTPYTSWDYKGWGYSVISESNEVLYPHILEIITRRVSFQGSSTLLDLPDSDW